MTNVTFYTPFGVTWFSTRSSSSCCPDRWRRFLYALRRDVVLDKYTFTVLAVAVLMFLYALRRDVVLDIKRVGDSTYAPVQFLYTLRRDVVLNAGVRVDDERRAAPIRPSV